MSVQAIIPNGQALTGDIDLRGQRLIGVIFSAAWTAAALSFQVADTTASAAGAVPGTYGEAFGDPGSGTATALAMGAAAGQVTMFTQGNRIIENCFCKIRSGTSGTPVNQGGARTLTLLTIPSR